MRGNGGAGRHDDYDQFLEEQQHELARKLRDINNEIERRRSQYAARHKTPEQRRQAFKLIKGGAVVVGALVALGAAIRRPAVAAASGTTVAGVGLTAVLYGAAPAEPPPNDRARTPYVMEEPAELEQGDADKVSAFLDDDPDLDPVPTATEAPTSNPAPAADVQVVPTAKPSLTPTPTKAPTPKVTASATVAPDPSPTESVDIEVTAENEAACLESKLVGLELAVCLEATR